ncbi:hypothetical protein [Mycolicibacterium vaccae]|uniref:hypothetical protein n=1 Tax=Mycolicibacterium vaccae TaxID=1810 RepID=UPI003D0006F6
MAVLSPPPVRPLPEVVRVPGLGVRWRYRERVAAVTALVAVGYGLDFAGLVTGALAGSRTPLLALTPVLALLIASGYHNPPKGVTDNESDWLFATILGTLGFVGIALVSDRFDTLAGLFRLDLLGAVLWAACATVILLGARHAQRMWRVWLFAVLSASPVPFLLAAGMFGGSDAVVAGLGVCYAAVAVYLAGARARRLKRLMSALLYLCIGWGLVYLLIDRLGLFATVTIAAGVLPVVAHVVMRRWIAPGVGMFVPTAMYPSRSWRSHAALPLLALVVAVVHTPAPQLPEPATVRGDWMHGAGLHDARPLPDAQRFLGAEAQFARYQMPGGPGVPAAAVDVITTPRLGGLRDHRDTVWYPTVRPLNFAETARTGPSPVQVREIFSDADSATDYATPHWYALTWEWHTPAGYQQVTVIVNQDTGATATEPPLPQLGAADTLLGPLLWIGRQQADTRGVVDPAVIERATDIADALLASAAARA